MPRQQTLLVFITHEATDTSYDQETARTLVINSAKMPRKSVINYNRFDFC